MKINGKQVDLEQIALMEYLEQNGYRKEMIAVEVNEEIIEKEDYDTTVLHAGDVVEIVSFMGGGAY